MSAKPGCGPSASEVRVGTHVVRLPSGLEGTLLGDAAASVDMDSFVRSSPDRTIYHSRAYLEFSRRANGCGDLLLVRRSGVPQVALPLHPAGRRGFTTGYSGLLLPDSDSETVLRGCVGAAHELLEANPTFGYLCLQSAQAVVERTERSTLIDSLLAAPHVAKREIYSRVLRLEGEEDGSVVRSGDGRVLDPALLENDLLVRYEADVRNQIRQAVRKGVAVGYQLLAAGTSPALTRGAYASYLPILSDSWLRTGMHPHAEDYWLSLSQAIQDGGGCDLVVLATTGGDRPVAGVTCHYSEGRALYWSGASTLEGRALRANPLCLHAAITLCRRLGTQVFELGRFDATGTNLKEHAVNRYKAQFRGTLVRIVNFQTQPRGTTQALRRLGSRLRATAGRLARGGAGA